jgi:hypothetical protein
MQSETTILVTIGTLMVIGAVGLFLDWWRTRRARRELERALARRWSGSGR